MDISLEEKLLQRGHHFSFFQAVRLLELLNPEAPLLGGKGPAKDEVIRLRPAMSQVFPVSDIAEIEKIHVAAEELERFRVTARFFGLYGSVSPLPIAYTEAIYEEDDPGAVRVREFLDIFHHRLLSLLYRGWLKYRYCVQFMPGGKDAFSRRLLPLTGVTESTRLRTVPQISLLRYLGLLTQLPRSAAGLKQLLTDFFDLIPVRITQFVGRRVTLKPSQRNFLGRQNCRPGKDLIIGESVLDRSGKFRITLGPVNFRTFLEFIPSGKGFKTIKDLVMLFVMDPLMFEIEVILSGDEVPEMELVPDAKSFLGWSGWLLSGKSSDVSVVFQVC